MCIFAFIQCGTLKVSLNLGIFRETDLCSILTDGWPQFFQNAAFFLQGTLKFVPCLPCHPLVAGSFYLFIFKEMCRDRFFWAHKTFLSVQMVNLAAADVSEDDKIKVMMNQSAYDPMTWVMLPLWPRFVNILSFIIIQWFTCVRLSSYNKKLGGALPANYTCFRCGNAGHHIRKCPSAGVRKQHTGHKSIQAFTVSPYS